MRGDTVQLAVKTQTGVNPFGEPIYEETLVEVDDVLIGQPTSEDVLDTLNLHGKKIAYVLGIPKGDTHTWENTEVYFFNLKFRTIGKPTTANQANIPLRWGQVVKVECYE